MIIKLSLHQILIKRMQLSEITSYLELNIPIALQESYDNCGLLTGNKSMEVSGVLITLDVTEQVILEAKAKNCNLILSHHPIIFSGLKSLTGKNETERIVISAIKEDIAIYAIHTNLDNQLEGVNQILCNKLGINNLQVLRPTNNQLTKIAVFCPVSSASSLREAMFAAGAGHIGNYSNCSFNTQGEGTFKALENATPFVGKAGELHVEYEIKIETIVPEYLTKKVVSAILEAHPYEEVAYDIIPLLNASRNTGAGMVGMLDKPISAIEYLKKIKNILGVGCIRHTQTGDKKIQKVAVCGGSGSFLIKDAINCNADIYITGDIKYHDFFTPENRMILADVGHFESEQFIKELIYTLLKKKFTTFALFISETDTNPINYL